MSNNGKNQNSNAKCEIDSTIQNLNKFDQTYDYMKNNFQEIREGLKHKQ
jgi:hypothetical protein